ncbi:hypothetical protein KRX56_04175 [Dermabacteraceae bacterium TAE3-ERU27]|nr:hypothetical protein [Dermabacteraceae bacterium TAE3-ERU27]
MNLSRETRIFIAIVLVALSVLVITIAVGAVNAGKDDRKNAEIVNSSVEKSSEKPIPALTSMTLEKAQSKDDVAGAYKVIPGALCDYPKPRFANGQNMLLCDDGAVIGELPESAVNSGLSPKQVALIMQEQNTERTFLVGPKYVIMLPVNIPVELAKGYVGGEYVSNKW